MRLSQDIVTKYSTSSWQKDEFGLPQPIFDRVARNYWSWLYSIGGRGLKLFFSFSPLLVINWLRVSLKHLTLTWQPHSLQDNILCMATLIQILYSHTKAVNKCILLARWSVHNYRIVLCNLGNSPFKVWWVMRRNIRKHVIFTLHRMQHHLTHNTHKLGVIFSYQV